MAERETSTVVMETLEQGTAVKEDSSALLNLGQGSLTRRQDSRQLPCQPYQTTYSAQFITTGLLIDTASLSQAISS
jgi:hypothetical protein